VKPHKIRYYLERRDPEFEAKMAHVLCIYSEVEVLKEAAGTAKEPSEAVAIISYDEKPGMQAIGATVPDLPPRPGIHAAFARDHDYKRHGTLSLLAGIDLVTGKQPFRPYFEGNQSLARYKAQRPLRIYLHPEAWLLAQSRRRLLFEARALGAPAHQSRFQARACRAHLGRRRGHQPAARRAYLVLQTRKSRLI
jgi:hypothetical protein